MRILFIVWDLSIGNDANINIIRTLSNELMCYGHKVYMLGNCNAKGILEIRSTDNINYRFIDIYKKGKGTIKEYKLSSDNKIKNIFKVAFKGMQYLEKYLNAKISQRQIMKSYINSIEEVCNDEKIDAAIAVSFPFTTSMALRSTNIKCKKIIYQLDPHFSNYKNRKKRKRLKEEIDAIKGVDLLLVTRLMINENRNNELSPYLNKMYPIDFPNIKPLIKKESISNITFIDDYINCVFVGNLYNDIRNPEYLMRLLLATKNSMIILHCIGGGDTEQLYDFKEILGDRLKIYGVVEPDQAINAMLNADVLINIGNTITNQMPSKIFDYISTGKPIVNICKLDNCPTLEYTRKYPLCLNIFESEGLTDDVVELFAKYCIENKGKRIFSSKIEEIYHDCTADVVGKQFLDIINEVMGDNTCG